MSSQSLTSTTTGAASTSSEVPDSSSSFRPSHTWTNPFPTSSSQAGQTGTADGGTSLNSSASLYLYTFLATLVLLLGVSAAIVFRSLILRRRHRAMIDEAIRNGTWVPPTNGRGRRIDPSQKPLVHDAHLIVEAKYAHHEWDLMKPFSVSYSVPAVQRVQAPAPAPPQPPRERIRGALRYVWSHFSSTPPPAPAPVIPLAPPPLPDASSGPLRVSVLIAMPSQNHNYAEHEELPHVEFGVAEVGVAAQESENGKAGTLSDDAASRV